MDKNFEEVSGSIYRTRHSTVQFVLQAKRRCHANVYVVYSEDCRAGSDFKQQLQTLFWRRRNQY